jgi:hypothetical protein
MKLEIGKKYKNRTGREVTIVKEYAGHGMRLYEGDNHIRYTQEGCLCSRTSTSLEDLIEEVKQPDYRLIDLLDKVNEQNVRMEDAVQYICPEQKQNVKFQTEDKVFDVLRGQVFKLKSFSNPNYPLHISHAFGRTLTEDGKEHIDDKYPRYLSLEEAREKGFDVPEQTAKRSKTVVVVFDPKENETYFARPEQTWYHDIDFVWEEITLEYEVEI